MIGQGGDMYAHHLADIFDFVKTTIAFASHLSAAKEAPKGIVIDGNAGVFICGMQDVYGFNKIDRILV